MNFSFTEDQLTIKDVADKIFRDLCDDESIRKVYQDPQPFHKALWDQLGESGLLATTLPGQFGGSELGLTELCLIIEGQGKAVAPIPLLETVVECAMPIAEFASDSLKAKVLGEVASGNQLLAAVRPYQGLRDKTPLRATQKGNGWLLNGDSALVSYAPLADGYLVTAKQDSGLPWLGYVQADAEGIKATSQKSMSGEVTGHIQFTDVLVTDEDVLGEGDSAAAMIEWQQQRTYIALAAQQVGILQEGIQRAADYTKERKQFGKPLASFQAVAQQAADAYMAVEALRGVYWRALGDVEAGVGAQLSSRVAKFWVAEAGHIAAHIFLHIHGGIGQDLDYPAHRFFIWAKQNENYLGGANEFASALGECIREQPQTVLAE